MGYSLGSLPLRLFAHSSGLKIGISILLLSLLICLSAADDADVRPPPALPQNATPKDLAYAPLLDYDQDSCYNVPAVGISNNEVIFPEGLSHQNVGYATYCRDQEDLDNTNAYSRQRCNNGWCAYMYGYYFEKDIQQDYSLADGGHSNDWEHIIVWVDSTGTPQFVSASKHKSWRSKVRY